MADLDMILHLLSDAARWLHARGLDQWPDRFPAERIRPAIVAGHALLAWEDGHHPVGCLVLEPTADPEFWTYDERQEKALYISKLTVDRQHKGLGATLLAWCEDYAARNGYQWLRLDAWKTNQALHDYYRRAGFTALRIVDLPHRGSGALFQKKARRRAEAVALHTEQASR